MVDRLPQWLAVAALAAGATVLPRYVQSAWRPDAYVVVMALVAVRARERRALGVAWLIGLLRDLASGGAPGVWALLYVVAAFALLWARRTMNLRPAPACAAASFLAAMTTAGFHAAAMSLRGRFPASAATLNALLVSAAATGLCAGLCSWAYDRYRRLVARRAYRRAAAT